MERKPPTPLRRPHGALGRLTLALALAAALGLAAAQSLAPLLPSDTLVAFGVQGLKQHEAKLQPIIDEWERLDLTNLLERAGGEGADDELPAELKGLTLFDVLGDEFWIAASASSFSPLPAVVLVARVSDRASALFTKALADEQADATVESLTEGNIPFEVYTSDDDDLTLAVARDGDFVALTTNPDTMRGVLRRYQGAAEPNFTDSPAYAATLAGLTPAAVSFLIDLPAAAKVAQPLAGGLGFDKSIERVAAMLKTVGVVASVARLTDAGIETLSIQALGDRSLDPGLYDLLTAKGAYPAGVLGFVPDTALGVQAGNLDLGAWWRYLNQLVAGLEELGVGDLDTFLAENIGLDLNQMLFSWMGAGAGTITMSIPSAAAPGMAQGNVLGDAVYLLAVTDEAAAQAGLAQFLTMATSMASSFMDPSGGAGFVQPTTRTSAGVNVTSYDLGEGITFEIAFSGGYLLLATSSTGMDAALAAGADGAAGVSGSLAALQPNVPAAAVSMALSNDQASLRALADTLLSQFGMAAGLAGSEDLDFEAVEAAGAALTQFVNFVADKFGGSYSYQVVDGGVVRGYGLSQVSW
ncbi:MAG: DUF3352 domain-containing protein [Trueperaceae bacterium]|nr:DUF3352 domain-containing protein [Trueperaceae bacterium]